MEAAKVVKEQGGENDLLARIAADPIFGVTLEELHDIVKPENMWAAPLCRPRNFSRRLWGRCWNDIRTWRRKSGNYRVTCRIHMRGVPSPKTTGDG